MKNIIIIFYSLLIISCSEKIQIEKIRKEYFGNYSHEIKTIGETDKYLLNSYEINIWATHTEYFKGIILKNEQSIIYKLRINDNLEPQIINDSLALVNNEYHLTKNEGCWIERYENGYKPIYNENHERINTFEIDTSKLKKGIYFLENGKISLVKKMNKIGFYYFTKHSRGIEKMLSIEELIKQ
ncbi:hypothetical protein Q4595_16205 [Wenyingzhuangia sp. 1_MG-2023]|nr:hypothetical protein [Wenyingzhuangia sp. 1_MG-2023]